MDYKDYYQIIGVSRTATADEIKRAYRKLARKYHPDVSKEVKAEDKFKEVQEAYEVLKDPEKRAAYDQLGTRWQAGQEFRPPPDWGRGFEHSRGNPGGDADFSDFFSSLFGARSPFSGSGGARGDFGQSGHAGQSGRDHVARIEIAIQDAFHGGSQTIELQSPELASDGQVVVKPRKLKVALPAGVVEGQQIRLAGQGSAGIGRGRSGDLYLEITFKKDPMFQAEGRDITLTLPIAPWEAALGATVETPTLGGAVDLRVPAGTESGQRMRLKGRGLPNPNGTAGDQYVVFKIVAPPANSDRVRELYEQLRRETTFDPRAAMKATE